MTPITWANQLGIAAVAMGFAGVFLLGWCIAEWARGWLRKRREARE